jgi:hypothetical protein
MREGSHNAELMAKLRATQPTLAKILDHKPLTLEDDIVSVYKACTSVKGEMYDWRAGSFATSISAKSLS